MKLTRRELAAVVSATAMAAAGTAGAAAAGAAGAATQADPRASRPTDELQAARDGIKTNGALLAQLTVPMATEPAFQFKA